MVVNVTSTAGSRILTRYHPTDYCVGITNLSVHARGSVKAVVSSGAITHEYLVAEVSEKADGYRHIRIIKVCAKLECATTVINVHIEGERIETKKMPHSAHHH